MLTYVLRVIGTSVLLMVSGLLYFTLQDLWAHRAAGQKETSTASQVTKSQAQIQSKAARSDVRTQLDTPNERNEAREIILSRPLFSVDRRPRALFQPEPVTTPVLPPKPTPVPKPTIPASPKLAIHGIIVSGAQAQALLSGPDLESRWYKVGETIGSWRIKSIFDRSIALQYQDIVERIEMYPR